jgi:mono/diheme cytochrome c family protein
MELRRPSFALLLALAASVSVLTACGGSDEPAGTVDQPISVGREESEVDPTPGDAGATTAAEGGETTAAEGGETTAAEGGETTAAEGGETTAAEGGETTAAAGGEGDPAAGKEVFASAGCSGCHTLADAGATGAVGPNLDDVKPDHATVVQFVTNGAGPMPAFGGQLSEQQINDVAAYVSSVAGQ